MANRGAAAGHSVRLGPPSPSSPVSPTTPTALMPASRDFLVPIGSTGALQKFSVANAAQKRKTVADRRAAQAQAQAQAHLAAAEAGWSALEVDQPPPALVRAASSLGTTGTGTSSSSSSAHGNINGPGFGASRGLAGGGLAPIEVHYRPSSASGYAPKSATMSSNLLGSAGSHHSPNHYYRHMPSSAGSSAAEGARPSAIRPRTSSAITNGSRPTYVSMQSTSSNGTGGGSGSGISSSRHSHGQHQQFPPPSTSSATSKTSDTSGAGAALPQPSSAAGEKKRTFGKGLRGLFSSGSTRKGSISITSNPNSTTGSSYFGQNSTSSFGASSSSSPYNGTHTSLTDSPDAAERDRERWSASAAYQQQSGAASTAAGGSGASRASAYMSPAAQVRASALAARDRENENDYHRSTAGAGSGSTRTRTASHGRHESSARRGDTAAAAASASIGSRSRSSTYDSQYSPPVPDKDPPRGASGSGSGAGYIGAGKASASSGVSTPQKGDARRMSTGPPKLEFNLPSPGFSFDEHSLDAVDKDGAPQSESNSNSAGAAMGEDRRTSSRQSQSQSPRSRSRSGTVTSVGRSLRDDGDDDDDSYGRRSTTPSGLGENGGGLAPRRLSRAALIARSHELSIDPTSGGSGGAARNSIQVTLSSEPSTASMDFSPGPAFGLHPSPAGDGSQPSVIRSPPTPVTRSASGSSRNLTYNGSSPASGTTSATSLTPPARDPSQSQGQSQSQRASLMSNLSQATSIVALTQGWHVEPDVNPPPHPSVLYGSPQSGAGPGPRTSPSMGSLRSQEIGTGTGSQLGTPARRGSESSPGPIPGGVTNAVSPPSDGRTSVASTVNLNGLNRASSATPLGRPYSAASTIPGGSSSTAEHMDEPDPFGPNPLLAPLFEHFRGSSGGGASGTTDDGSGSGGVLRSRQGSFDSGTHGHSQLSHGAQGGNSTLGHGTLGHGSSGAAAAAARSEDGTSTQGHPTSSGSSWATASSGHGGVLARRPGSSGGAAVTGGTLGPTSSSAGGAASAGNSVGAASSATSAEKTKSGRPTTPRGGVASGAEQPPSALRTVPSSSSSSSGGAGRPEHSPAKPSRHKDRPRPGTGNSVASSTGGVAAASTSLIEGASSASNGANGASAVGSSASAAAGTSNSTNLSLPSPDPAMLATLAKLESAQAGSTASPLNFSTFSEAGLRDALANGGIDLGNSGIAARPGRAGTHDGQEEGDDDVDEDEGPSGRREDGTGANASGVLADRKAKQAKAGTINGEPVPEGVDPKTYVPPNALTRTRRGAQVKTAAVRKVPATNGTAKVGAQWSPGRFSLDSEPETGQLSASEVAVGEDAIEEEDEDLSSLDGTSDDDDDMAPTELEQLSATSASTSLRNVSRNGSTSGASAVDSSANTTPRGATPAVDSQMPANAWVEVEAALRRFQEEGATGGGGAGGDGGGPAPVPNDKGTLLRTILLPFLAIEVETPNVEPLGASKFSNPKARRALFFEWIRSLLVELQQTQTSADRGAILESIGCVLESRNLSARILERDAQDLDEFNSIFGIILGWAIGELNKKGVYQNTLIFTGRLLAIAFFRIRGVASKLLRALPTDRFALERISSEAEWDLHQPRSFERYRKRFPVHLQDFCFQDARSYLKMIEGQTPSNAGGTGSGLSDQDMDDDRYLVRQDEVEVEMAGNWLRRWQSDDSELFFSFIRSYHRQMATLLMSTKRLRRISKWFFGGPGYAHLATSVHQKCLSMVHREIFSVTTLSSQKTFNPGETANVLSGSTAGKPRHLDAANRRCTAIVVEIARTGNPNTNSQLFGGMLGVHVKSVVKRTSLYDAEGVFCLLDWLDGIISHMDAAELPVDNLLDIDFIIDTLSMLLSTADHALALMRTIAFCYSNFGVLTSHKDTRLRFCERILLEPTVFHKLFLSWSVTIRAYFLHLLVFRLARISDFPFPKQDPSGKTAIRVARLFNQRLDEIRRRYEELSPSAAAENSEDGDDDFTRFKNRPSSFVSTIKHTPSIHRQESMSKAERILGIGLPDPAMASKPGADTGKQSLAAKWLRGLGSKSKKNRWSGGKGTVGMTDTDNPTVNNEPRRKMMPLDELDFDDVDAGDDSSDTESDEPVAATLSGEGVNGADSVSDARAIAPAEGAAALAADPDIGLGDNITPDASFDLQSAAPTLAAGPGRPGASPRVSRAFSKRSSILPGPAFELVGEGDGEDVPPVPSLPAHLQHPYDKSLHTYAVQSLTEYERTIQEHDQYFAALPENEKAQVPRLQVNWPAMWQD